LHVTPTASARVLQESALVAMAALDFHVAHLRDAAALGSAAATACAIGHFNDIQALVEQLAARCTKAMKDIHHENEQLREHLFHASPAMLAQPLTRARPPAEGCEPCGARSCLGRPATKEVYDLATRGPGEPFGDVAALVSPPVPPRSAVADLASFFDTDGPIASALSARNPMALVEHAATPMHVTSSLKPSKLEDFYDFSAFREQAPAMKSSAARASIATHDDSKGEVEEGVTRMARSLFTDVLRLAGMPGSECTRPQVEAKARNASASVASATGRSGPGATSGSAAQGEFPPWLRKRTAPAPETAQRRPQAADAHGLVTGRLPAWLGSSESGSAEKTDVSGTVPTAPDIELDVAIDATGDDAQGGLLVGTPVLARCHGEWRPAVLKKILQGKAAVVQWSHNKKTAVFDLEKLQQQVQGAPVKV